MRVGIATDHGGFALKQELAGRLRRAGYRLIDFGAHRLKAGDDYPNYARPLGEALAAGKITRGVAVCSSGVGIAVCLNKIAGVRACLIENHFAARQGVEDDDLNVICLGGRTIGPELAWVLVETFLGAKFSHEPRHLRRLRAVAALERHSTSKP